MQFFYFIADWILNIIGGCLVIFGFVVGIGLFIGWISGMLRQDPPPSQGLVNDTVKAGASGCGSIGLIYLVMMLIVGIGAYLIELL